MKKLVPPFPFANVVFVGIAIIVAAAVGVGGQSGRSIPKRPQAVQVATPEPTPLAKPKPTPLVSVKVISDIQANAYYAFPKPEFMHEWALERLKRSPLLNVSDGGFANRRDAIKQAEKETEAYVVMLQLEDDPFGRADIAGRPAAGQVWIFVSVLSPRTGKTKDTKRITLNKELRSGLPPSIVRTCRTGIFGNDYLLLEASLEAAEYVMSSFGIPIPPDCPKL